jgi:hypothetical protein
VPPIRGCGSLRTASCGSCIPNRAAATRSTGTWVNVISNPLASQPTFEKGRWLCDGVSQRPFLFRGTWYFTMDYLSGNSPCHPERYGEHIFRLDWQNRKATWVTKLPQIPNADVNEGQFVVLKDSSLLYQSRSYGGIYQTRALDEQFQFSAPALWGFYPSVASRHFLGRTPEGRLAVEPQQVVHRLIESTDGRHGL